MAWSVECPTLGFRSGSDLRVMGWSPASGSVLSAESAEFLSPSVPLPHVCALSLSNE